MCSSNLGGSWSNGMYPELPRLLEHIFPFVSVSLTFFLLGYSKNCYLLTVTCYSWISYFHSTFNIN